MKLFVQLHRVMGFCNYDFLYLSGTHTSKKVFINLFSRISHFKTKGPSDCFVGCGIIAKPLKKLSSSLHCSIVGVCTCGASDGRGGPPRPLGFMKLSIQPFVFLFIHQLQHGLALNIVTWARDFSLYRVYWL